MSENKKSNSFVKGLIVGLLLAFILSMTLAAILGIHIVKSSKQASVSSEQQSKAEQTEGEKERLEINHRIERKMELVEKVIADYYYKDEYDVKEMENGIYRGMVDSIGDPYSQYFSPEELEKLQKESQGIFFGIGATLTLDEDTGFGMIKEVKPDSAAMDGGLKDGDLLYQVDGVSTYGLSLSEIVSMVRGDEGTVVKLRVVRTGVSDFLDFDITRRKFEEETVRATMYDNGIGYIQILEFDSVTTQQFEESLEMLKKDGMQGLILDLRSNPGGSLVAVTDIARMLLPEGLIVYTEDRDGKREEFYCDGTRALNMPMVVLINGASASASEILSGAIKDHGIGTLMGTTTFGKGIVQRVIGLSDGSAVKVTISTYFTPNGTNIHGIGIEPDVECVFDSKAYYENRYDNQFERAVQYLSEQLGVEYAVPDNAPEEKLEIPEETEETETTAEKEQEK